MPLFVSLWHTKVPSKVKVYPRQTWNFRTHAVSPCIGLWFHRPIHATHRLMHACTACIAPWHHRLMHEVTAWALLFCSSRIYLYLQLLWVPSVFFALSPICHFQRSIIIKQWKYSVKYRPLMMPWSLKMHLNEKLKYYSFTVAKALCG